MSNNWKKYKLGELTEKITKGTTPSTLGGAFVEKGVNFIKSESVSYDGRIDKNTFAFIDHATHEKLKRSQLQKDDILFSMAGIYLGKNGIVTDDMLPANTNQALAIIRLNKEKALVKFIHFYLRQTDVVKKVNSMSGQSAQPNVNFEEIKSIEVSLPDLPTQRSIASILSSLDDKIELNLQMNQTFENMAQTIFKEWFINFNFPGFDGKLVDGLPKRWKRLNLTELVNTVSDTHKFPKGNAIFLNTSDILEGKFLHSNYSQTSRLPGQAKKSIKQGDILFTEIRPANKRYAFVDFESDDYVVSTKLMVLRSKGIVDNLVTYFFIKSDETLGQLQSLAETRSGTFPQITYSELAKIEMNVPDKTTLSSFTALIQAAFSKIRLNQAEIKALTQIRDSLLPKLMSGKIEVN